MFLIELMFIAIKFEKKLQHYTLKQLENTIHAEFMNEISPHLVLPFIC